MKDEIQNYLGFLKSLPAIKSTFERVFVSISLLSDLKTGFAILTGDIRLAESLIKDIIPDDIET